LSAKGVRPTSAATRPADVDTSHKQQNGSVTVSRQTAGGLGDSMVGLHHAVLYVLGEKTQMKVLATSDNLLLSNSITIIFIILFH